jgi:hypothetical protein
MFELHQKLNFCLSDDEEFLQQFVFVHNLIMEDYLLEKDELMLMIFVDQDDLMMINNHIQFPFHLLFLIVDFYGLIFLEMFQF